MANSVKKNKLHFKSTLNFAKINRTSSLLEETSGVYVITFKKRNRCIYVGEVSKQTVQRRLLQHMAKSHNKVLNDWIKAFPNGLDVCFVSCIEGKEKYYEDKLKNLLKPEANIK